jgi:hypothetical protein
MSSVSRRVPDRLTPPGWLQRPAPIGHGVTRAGRVIRWDLGAERDSVRESSGAPGGEVRLWFGPEEPRGDARGR